MIKNYGQLSLEILGGQSFYDSIVSKDNKWRKFKEHLDFSFVNELLADKYCIDYGRPAKDPVLMFKLEFIKHHENFSDSELMDNVNVNMALKYFLGMEPWETVGHSTSMTKFRKLRLNDEETLEKILSEIFRQARSKGLIKSKTLIVDATHTRSAHEAKLPIEILRELGKNLRKKIYRAFPELKGQVPQKPHPTASLEEESEYMENLLKFARLHPDKPGSVAKEIASAEALLKESRFKEIHSIHDPEARVGYKGADAPFHGYKTHIAMTDERMISAIEVTTGEVSDGKYLGSLIEKTEGRGMEIDELLADAAYSGKDNLELLESKSIAAYAPLNPAVSNGSRKENTGFEYNKDADMMRCPAGRLSFKKARQGKKGDKKTRP